MVACVPLAMLIKRAVPTASPHLPMTASLSLEPTFDALAKNKQITESKFLH